MGVVVRGAGQVEPLGGAVAAQLTTDREGMSAEVSGDLMPAPPGRLRRCTTRHGTARHGSVTVGVGVARSVGTGESVVH